MVSSLTPEEVPVPGRILRLVAAGWLGALFHLSWAEADTGHVFLSLSLEDSGAVPTCDSSAHVLTSLDTRSPTKTGSCLA